MTIREDAVVDYLLSEAGRARGLKAPNGATYRVSSFRRRGEDQDRPAIERDGQKIVGSYNCELFKGHHDAALWALADGQFSGYGTGVPIFDRPQVMGDWELAEVGP